MDYDYTVEMHDKLEALLPDYAYIFRHNMDEDGSFTFYDVQTDLHDALIGNEAIFGTYENPPVSDWDTALSRVSENWDLMRAVMTETDAEFTTPMQMDWEIRYYVFDEALRTVVGELFHKIETENDIPAWYQKIIEEKKRESADAD